MNYSYKVLTIWTKVAWMLIPVGIGHGIAPIGLLEIFSVASPKLGNFMLSPMAPYEDAIYAAALYGLAGHLLIAASLMLKRSRFFFG